MVEALQSIASAVSQESNVFLRCGFLFPFFLPITIHGERGTSHEYIGLLSHRAGFVLQWLNHEFNTLM